MPVNILISGKEVMVYIIANGRRDMQMLLMHRVLGVYARCADHLGGELAREA